MSMKNILLLSLLLISLTANCQKRSLNPSDIYRIKSTGAGLVSPEGGWVLYTVTATDSAKNNRNTDVWMMRWDGTDNIQLTNSPEPETNAQWSPDGKYISFVSSRNGGTSQIYLLNRMGGDAIKLTDLKGDLA